MYLDYGKTIGLRHMFRKNQLVNYFRAIKSQCIELGIMIETVIKY